MSDGIYIECWMLNIWIFFVVFSEKNLLIFDGRFWFCRVMRKYIFFFFKLLDLLFFMIVIEMNIFSLCFIYNSYKNFIILVK